MTERPILFSGPLVRAILDGRKTVTRRLSGLDTVNVDPDAWTVESVDDSGAWFRHRDGRARYKRNRSGAPDDRLWVRETWAVPSEFDRVSPLRLPKRARSGVIYRADAGELPEGYSRWRPSIHIPRWASRVDLDVVSVRPERLQDITPAEVLREGVGDHYNAPEVLLAKWCELWDGINPEHSWAANPWVWRVEFKLVRP